MDSTDLQALFEEPFMREWLALFGLFCAAASILGALVGFPLLVVVSGFAI